LCDFSFFLFFLQVVGSKLQSWTVEFFDLKKHPKTKSTNPVDTKSESTNPVDIFHDWQY
jgi:hypothetical protein